MKFASRIALAVSAVAVFVSLFPPASRAQDAGPVPPPAATDPGQKPPARFSPFAKGTILEIDRNSSLFLLDTADGQRQFFWTPNTYVYRGKEKLSMDKLRVGDRIKLAFRVNDRGLPEVKRIKVDLTPPAQTNQQTTASQ